MSVIFNALYHRFRKTKCNKLILINHMGAAYDNEMSTFPDKKSITFK